MAGVELNLSEQEQTALEAIAQQIGKTPGELIREAIKRLIAHYQYDERLGMLRQARGMWKDRTDLPSLADLRRAWDRRP